MSSSPEPSEVVLPMDESLEPDVVVTTTMQQPTQSNPHFARLKSRYQATRSISYLRTPSIGDGRFFFSNLVKRTMTNRQRAEIQLEGILNDPEVSLPAFTRHPHGHLSNDNMSIEEASKLLNTPAFIIKRLVNAIYASNKNELNRFEIQKLTRVLNASMDVRVLLFFMLLDENGNQYVTDTELSEFYEEYLKGLKTFNNNRLQEFIPVLLHKFGLDEKSRIDFEEFFSIISKDPILIECLSQFTINPDSLIRSTPEKQTKFQRFFANMFSQQKIYEQQKDKLTLNYIKDNLSRIIVLILYILVNFALFLYAVIYRSTKTKSHVLVVLARIGGILLDFNCSLVIVLMLKETILLIRTNTLLRKLIPVDDHIDFHRVVGRVIAGLAILHAVAHMANFGRLKEHSWGAYMFTTKPDIGWVGGFAPLSGVIICVILAIIVICSMEWIRRGGHFEVFYWTHLLYLPFFVFLIVHAEDFWKWIIGPLSLFLLEKVYSILKRYSLRSGRTHLRSATIEQSNVISLNIHRPKNFTFRPGDYITINLPHVALYEYHPFTISSAPEDTEYLTVHIQAVGNWTKQVLQYFKDMSDDAAQTKHIKVYRADLHPDQVAAELQEDNQRDNPEGVENNADNDRNINNPSQAETRSIKPEPVIIKGPYSSCARYVFDCKHVVLIGGGIGITPYASILSSLMSQFRASRIVCKNCQSINYYRKGLVENHRLKKVDFIWVNRDQKNFEWFLNLLRQLEQEQEDYLASNSDEQRFLDIHLFFTELKHDANIGHVPLDLVTKIWAEVAGRDIFTSLKSKTHVGRPKWDEIFDQLDSDENALTDNDVNVFFCGPSTMGSAIREHSAAHRFRFYEEQF